MKHTYKTIFFLVLISISFFSNGQVVINEIQSSNTKTIADENFQYDDWIEIYNAGSSTVNLSGYGLSDDSLKPYKFRFPDYNLAAGTYVLVFAADTDQTVLTHWETAVKANDSWKYRANTTAFSSNWRTPSFNDGSWSTGTGGIGMGDSDDGTTITGCASVYMRRSFSISDTSKIMDAVFNMDFDDGFVAYLNGVEIARMNLGSPGIVPAWNELSPLGHEALLYQNEYPDSFHIDYNTLRSLLVNGTNVLAVEVHNTSGSYTDMSSNPYLTFSVKNGSVLFSSVPSWFHSSSTTYFHADFKISKTGETIFLTNGSNTLLDKKATGNLEIDNSIARIPDGSSNWCLTDVPTPKTSNNSTACKTTYATFPIFSLQGGFYTGTRSLNLTTTFPGGSIRYTTDGSDVTESSTLYSGPISISTTKTIRARVFAPNAIGSTTVTNTYFINFSCRLPVVALTTDPDNLYDYNSGIFADGPGYTSANPHWGANYWLDLEKDVTLEFYERDKSLQFKFNSGLAVTGGWSRSANQKSLEIKLGDKYGLSSLNYSLQSLKPWNDKWDNFILHMAGNDRDKCHMRDALMNRILKGTYNNYIAYEPCLLTLNGENWGIYYFRENDDHHWVEGNYGYKADEIDFLKESYFYTGIEVKKGSDSAFFAMHNYATTTSPTDPAYYNTISSMMDLQNMADYFIAETYYPNDDWMGGTNNNLKLWRPKKGDGKFKYLIYDLEFGLGYSGSVSNNMLSVARNASPHNYNSDLFKYFTQNETFKKYFINRYADLVNTIFLPSNVQANAYVLRDSLKYDYHLQNEKWGGADSATWISNIASMLSFANNRPSYARNFVQSEFQLTSQVTLTLQVSPAGAGVIQISTITPTSYPWNGVYFNGNPVTITAIPNPGYTFDHWRSNVVISSNNTNQSVTYNFTANDVITCYFTGAAASPQLSFSELNYHSDSLNESGDWIEIHNRGSLAIDLSNWIFRDEAENHTYKLPVTTSIPANGYLVLASDLEKFSAIYPSVTNVIGDFKFDFSNSGEELRLFDRNDQLHMSVLYSDQLPFATTADAGGYTLERLNETANADDGNNWFAGCLLGSPGREYSGPLAQITTSGSTAICNGSSVILNVSSTSGATYQWYKDNNLMSGSTGTSITVSTAGSYTVKVTASGCSASSSGVALTVGAVEQISSTTSASRCGTGTLTLSAAGTSNLNWFADSTSATILGTGVSFTTPSITQTTGYFVQASGVCPSARVRVNAVINAVTASPVTSNVSRCGTGNVNLTASDTATISWFDASVGGNLVATGSSFTTPSLNQTTTYYLSAGTFCPSPRISVNAIINGITAAPVVTNASRCGAGSVLLLASDTAVIRWYSAPSGGSLLFTGTNFNTPSISSTTDYYVEAGTVCPSARVTATATIDVIASPPAVSDVARCGNGTVTLTANSSTAAWYSSNSGGSPLATGLTFTTPSLSSTTTYYVQSGTTCPSSRVAANAIINPFTADPVVTHAENCGTGSVTLSAVDTAVVRWYTGPLGGSPFFTGTNYVTPVLSQTTTYYVEAGTGCISNRIPVTATINPITANPTTNDVTRCGSGTITLQANSSSTINWYDAPNGTLLFTGSAFTTPSLTTSASYFIQAGVNCPSSFVQVNANIDAFAEDPAVADNSRCGAGTVNLSASSPEILKWYDAPNGTLLFTGSNFTSPQLSSTTTYYVQAGAVCTSNFIPVTATINMVSPDPVTTGGNSCGAASLSLTGNSSGTVNWFDAPNGTMVGTGATFITPVLNSTTTYYAQVAGICPSNYIAAVAVINPIPSDPSVADVNACGAVSVQLTANSPDVINWFDVPNGTVIATGNIFSTPVLNSTTTYYLQAGDVCLSNFSEVTVTVNQIEADPTGIDASSCGPSSFTLLANGSGTINWYDAVNGNFITTGNSFTTPILTSTTVLYIQTAGICPSNFVPVEATVNPVTALSVTDASSCGSASLTLNASSTETITWLDAPGGNILGTGNTFITPFLNSSIQYFAIAGGLCPSEPLAVNANIYTIPVVSLGNDTAIETGNSIVLDAGSGFASYSWNTSATTQFISTAISGDYSVLVTDANGCSASDTISISIISKNGSVTSHMQSEVYPNPFVDQITIRFEYSDTDKLVKLFAANGKLISEKQIAKFEMQMILDASELASGVYFLSIEDKYSKFVNRIIKK
ncbi:MAG: CotH kinase family protein [Bacteroidota bacterium]